MTIQTEEVIDDRRAAIEAAIEAAEQPQKEAVQESAPPANEGDADKGPEDNDGGSPEAEGAAGEGEPGGEKSEGESAEGGAGPAPVFPVDKPPQSWRAPQKAKWEKLEPDIRQEVMRREREITKTLGETAQARQFTNQFAQAIQPYAARLQSLGAHPITAVQELLKSDHILSTAPKLQRAQLMAKLIKDYDIDVRELDNVLSGQGHSVDPVQSTVEQLLQQQLAPFQQYLQKQQQIEQQRAQQQEQEIAQTVESMQDNPKFPHFDAVRDDMADIVELAAKKGLYLSLEQAYSRAIALNPEVSALIASQKAEEERKAAARAEHARAQKALKASKSVNGAPGGAIAGRNDANDRRATIAAAFESVGGR